MALAAWSEPRATADVDVILWLDPASELDRAFDLLRSAGVKLDERAARDAVARRGMFAGRAGATRIDVFLPSIPFYEAARSRRVRTRIGEGEAWVHSAEVLAVFKMLFYRPKDLIDVERMVRVQRDRFDLDFVRSALVEMLDTDPRIESWDAICARLDATPE